MGCKIADLWVVFQLVPQYDLFVLSQNKGLLKSIRLGYIYASDTRCLDLDCTPCTILKTPFLASLTFGLQQFSSFLEFLKPINNE